MAAIIAILTQLMPLVPVTITGIGNLISWIAGVRAAAKQTSEWTPEAEAAFMALLINLIQSPAWQPDKK